MEKKCASKYAKLLEPVKFLEHNLTLTSRIYARSAQKDIFVCLHFITRAFQNQLPEAYNGDILLDLFLPILVCPNFVI